MNRLIEWFARNTIAANLLMVVIIAGGLLTLGKLKQEIFPEFSSDIIQATVAYLGAAPEEVEEGVCIRIEEAIYGLAGVKRILANAREGIGVVTVELLPGTNSRQLLEEVKMRVDAIDTFPEEAEKPVVEEATLRRQVINVAVSGNTEKRSLRRIAERVRDELSALSEISLVQLSNARPYEISIEIAENRLRRHGITFDDVARAVRRSSLDLPGGSVKTLGGEILVRTKGQAYTGREFEKITLLSRSDGTRLLLGEVATIVDGFADTDQSALFDGQPAILIKVFRVGEQSALSIAETVKEYVETARHRVPEGVYLTTWADDAAVLKSRVHLLVDNGLMGLLLVCIALSLFLRLKLALWVAWGIPLSFLGAVWLLPAFEISINLISLFAFIVVLGIVVDDAIIVGENIYTHIQRGKDPLTASIEGAQEVTLPVVFAVLTSVVAFAPLLSVPGNTGKVMGVIPAIVIATLVFSLIESLLILPAHLSHLSREEDSKRTAASGLFSLLSTAWLPINQLVGAALKIFIEKIYSPTLEWTLRWRYLTLSMAIAALLFTASWVLSGRIKLVFFPPVDADNVVALVTLPQGTPVEATARALAQIEEAALTMLDEFQAAASPGAGKGPHDSLAPAEPNKIHRHVLRSIGGQPYREAMNQKRGKSRGFSGSHLGEVNIELTSAEERSTTGTEVVRRWRELTGPVPDAVELIFTSSLFSTGNAIDIQLSAREVDTLRQAADRLKARLGEFTGVTDITDSFRAGKQEIKLGIKPEAETLGLSLSHLARQVRQGFYGEEVQRIQRGRDDVKVMVRYPREKRRSLGDLESMRIRTADGTEVDFSEVATAELGRGYATIQRADRQRIINVSADVDQSQANANEILAELSATSLPQLTEKFPGLTYSLEGEQREQRETFSGLARGFVLALLGIYALLAIPFRSYFQPMIVMGVIPFGIVGVVWGHMIMGLPLTVLSMFGLVALTGVVVNDSLIMVDFINRAYRGGLPVEQALRQAGTARFRPILLTSLTTFVGLSPLLFEKSMQAQFLIPMAVSLGFGVVFATLVTLILVPVGYLMLEDFARLFRRVYGPEEHQVYDLATATNQDPESDPSTK